MQQPELIKHNGVYISDHRTLVDLGNALHYTGDSILRLREAVDDYFKSVERAMEDKIGEFRNKLNQAQQWLSAAQSALNSCRSRRYYDSEKERWVEPNCSCEERDVRNAQREVDRIQKIIDKLESIKSDVEREFSEYRQPVGIITPGGGHGVLEWLGDSHTKAATQKMDRILEIVEQYLRVSFSKYGAPSTIPDTASGSMSVENSAIEGDKAERFRKGVERIAERDKAQDYGDRALNKPNAVSLCSRCNRPKIACTCPRDPREYTNIFNYDFSR